MPGLGAASPAGYAPSRELPEVNVMTLPDAVCTTMSSAAGELM